MTDGDRDTALDEAESRIHLVERGFADYILAREMRFLPRRGNLRVISQA